MNMKKEYRTEMRQLQKAERKLLGDCKKMCRTMDRMAKAIVTQRARGKRNTYREIGKLQRRKAILEGRLS